MINARDTLFRTREMNKPPTQNPNELENKQTLSEQHTSTHALNSA